MSHRRGLVFLVWADIPPELEAGYNEWYNREHVPDRVLRVPGFVQGRRLCALTGAPKYVTFYDLAGPEVLDSDIYVQARRNSDANSQRYQPHFRNVLRLVGDTIADAGQGEGGFAAMLAIDPAGSGESVERWAAQYFRNLVGEPGVVRAGLFRANRACMSDVERLAAGSIRARLRPPDSIPHWIACVEGTARDAVSTIESALSARVAENGGTIRAAALVQQMLRLAP